MLRVFRRMALFPVWTLAGLFAIICRLVVKIGSVPAGFIIILTVGGGIYGLVTKEYQQMWICFAIAAGCYGILLAAGVLTAQLERFRDFLGCMILL